jgi:hypothetical protein
MRETAQVSTVKAVSPVDYQKKAENLKLQAERILVEYLYYLQCKWLSNYNKVLTPKSRCEKSEKIGYTAINKKREAKLLCYSERKKRQTVSTTSVLISATSAHFSLPSFILGNASCPFVRPPASYFSNQLTDAVKLLMDSTPLQNNPLCTS